MGIFFAMSIPGLVVLLILVAATERFVHGGLHEPAKGRTTGPLGGVAFDELTTLFYAGKRDELVHRDAVALMRHEASDALPDAQTGVLRLRLSLRPPIPLPDVARRSTP